MSEVVLSFNNNILVFSCPCVVYNLICILHNILSFAEYHWETNLFDPVIVRYFIFSASHTCKSQLLTLVVKNNNTFDFSENDVHVFLHLEQGGKVRSDPLRHILKPGVATLDQISQDTYIKDVACKWWVLHFHKTTFSSPTQSWFHFFYFTETIWNIKWTNIYFKKII